MKRDAILTRLEDIKVTRKKLNIYTPNASNIHTRESLHDGISVIIPSYKGEDVISKCLESLLKQTIKKDLFEVIIVLNGEKDSTEKIVSDFKGKNNMNNIRLLYSEKPGASLARNVGISEAKREYSVFLDDDDYVSHNFLEEMYRLAKPNKVVVSQIIDVNQEYENQGNNPINNQLIKAVEKDKRDLMSLNMVATINACKLVPTRYIKEVEYDTKLRSGEDVVFFMTLFVKNELEIEVIPPANNAIYFRLLRENSVSRKAMSFDFNVVQRLMVIKELDKLFSSTTDINKSSLIKQKINAQSQFINRYIKEHPSERETVIKKVREYNLSYTPYSIINKGLADTLVISYCFPPYVDTAGTVMAKRILEANEAVDVVYNKMDNVRPKDMNLDKLVDHMIEERFPIPSYSSFSNWKAINEFAKSGIEKLNKSYSKIYSRAMWPGSHFLAYEYKKKHPNVKWVAEFSDPLILDIHSKQRMSVIDDTTFIKNANHFIKKTTGLGPVKKEDNLFFWCEYLPYVLADELIFTNEHQLSYMVENFPIKEVRWLIKKKARIVPHPTLSKEFYHNRKSSYSLDNEMTNVAYFGTFYKTRNLNVLFDGLENADKTTRNNIKLHIFTSNPKELKEELKGTGIENNIEVNPYVDYSEFLNLTTKFDCLVVNDAHTKAYKSVNPYLPSKLSDYIGSGTKIWGICEDGSILSNYNLDFKSELGNTEQTTKVFRDIVNSKKL
ncbi:glycosyltransferase (plasmid) [Rossellomorea sp. AcN35-11]|nr:glycosyltransferase [Rossellomorea aquimaris]WJV32358.1 glycosyltransferase [Rossellomorea sp. AcN35-11]